MGLNTHKCLYNTSTLYGLFICPIWDWNVTAWEIVKCNLYKGCRVQLAKDGLPINYQKKCHISLFGRLLSLKNETKENK
jgi:hypothetical protein